MLFSFPVLVPESTPHNNAKLMWAVGALMYRMATEMARKWIFNDAHCCEFCLPLLLPVSCGNGMFLSSLRPKPALLSSPPLSPKPCTPHPVSGGDQLCQSRQTTHTHTYTHSADWRTKPLVLPIKASHASALLLSSPYAAVRGRHDTIAIASLFQEDTVVGRKSGWSLAYGGIFLSLLLLMSWDAGGAQRE